MTAKARQHNKREAARVRRFLQRAPGDIADGVKDALLESAETVRADAIKLADSVRVKQALADPRAIGVTSNGFRVEFGIRTKPQKKFAWFAHFLEWGTRPHSLKKGSRRGGHGRGADRLAGQSGGWHPGSPAKPFMTPAAEMNRAANRRTVKATFKAAVRKALRHG